MVEMPVCVSIAIDTLLQIQYSTIEQAHQTPSKPMNNVLAAFDETRGPQGFGKWLLTSQQIIAHAEHMSQLEVCTQPNKDQKLLYWPQTNTDSAKNYANLIGSDTRLLHLILMQELLCRWISKVRVRSVAGFNVGNISSMCRRMRCPSQPARVSTGGPKTMGLCKAWMAY